LVLWALLPEVSDDDDDNDDDNNNNHRHAKYFDIYC